VLAVLYLIFNEGYATTAGSLVRVDLCQEAIRLARVVDTDWPQIAGLYAALHRMQPPAVVELNRIVVVAMADGPATALPLLDGLEAELGRYHLFHATRADLLRRLDRPEEAEASYRGALGLATNPAERRFLERRISEVAASP
jgi:RNA polymerase sigma-70 factor (ECF subfamily)